MSTGATETDPAEAEGPRSGVSQAPQGLVGETIDDRYRVEALLGEGGMGLVYRVTHTRLNKPLAIKILRRENTGDQDVLARFRREAESASAIGNQHIIDIHDFGTLADGSTYFVMECLEGMDLIEAMDLTRRMPEERAVYIATQICKALGAAHEAGIVHRDLKPENVFLTLREDGNDFVKVLDFGIAKVAHGPTRLTQKGEVLGTPHYMSPEQCEGENVDHRTDIYALGVLLYEMLTGHVPHDADTVMGILTKHLYEDPIPPRVRMPQMTESLEAVILRCLDKVPERRYQTMRELEADLDRVRSGERPRGPDTVTLTPTRPPRAPTKPTRPSKEGARKGWAVGIGLLVVALFAVLGIRAVLDSEETGASEPGPSASTVIEAPPDEDSSGPRTARAGDPPRVEKGADADREPRRKTPVRRRPRPRPDSTDRGTPTILDPWK